MGDYEVIQRTQDGFFNGNALLKLWNATNPTKQRKMNNFLDKKETKEFIEELTKDMQNTHLPKMADGDYQVVTITKGKITKNGRTEDSVWMHPLLFIDFAMYINPRFKVQVLKFVQDQLIITRNNIADQHKKWKCYMSKIGCVEPIDYANNQKVFNTACLGFHKNGVRDYLDQEQLTDMMMQETLVYQLIDIGAITDKNSFYQYCKKLFFLRFGDKVISERAQLPAAE